MPRIADLPFDQWSAELQAMVGDEPLSPLEEKARSIMANAPHMGIANGAFMGTALAGARLPRRLLELVRLRIAFHNQCRSCMAMRFEGALDDGLTEELVCSLERPMEAPNLTPSDKAALNFADLMATNHFAIDDATFDDLRRHFDEGEIVELGVFCGYFIGFGRFLAVLDITEELPSALQDKSRKVGPWEASDNVVVHG